MDMRINLILLIGLIGIISASFPSNVLAGDRQQLQDYLNNNDTNPGREYYRNGNSLGTMIRDMMTVNVPLFYDMVRNGSSLGVNVLGGLVKVERGQEAERSGLRGNRPLSVRVFGVPVFERGNRVYPSSNRPTKPAPEGIEPDAEELPIIS